MTIEVGAARVLVPTGIRRGDVIDVRALVEHPMATGLFRDARGNPIPAYFINDVSVTYGDREAAHFVWSSGISRDPFVEFSLRADRDRKSTRLNSSHGYISYAVFCLKKKKKRITQ